MKSTFLILIALIQFVPTNGRYTGDVFDDWKEKCYNEQCIKLRESKLIFGLAQKPPRNMTVKSNYRKFMRAGTNLEIKTIEGAMVNYTWLEDDTIESVLLDNVRFTANPDSYQLHAKEDIKRGDRIF